MLTLGTHAIDGNTRFAGSAHTRDDVHQGTEESRAKEAHVSLQDKDVLLSGQLQRADKLQRAHRVLNIELSVNLSANFHRSTGPASVASYIPPRFDSQTVIDNVMSFIQDRVDDELAAGKSADDLAEILSQAEAGVARGLKEAESVLQEMGAFDEDVQQGVQDVSDVLNQKLQELGSYVQDQVEMAADQPHDAASVQSTPSFVSKMAGSMKPIGNVTPLFAHMTPLATSGVASFGQSFSKDETFEFEVKTNDGDVIRLNIGRGASYESAFSHALQGDARQGYRYGAAYSEESTSYTHISYSVEGELDESELAALDDLFGKVNKLADTFYSGHLEQAFNQAIKLNYDATELAGFSLNLTQTQSITEMYQEIAQFDEPRGKSADKSPSLFDSFRPVGHFIKEMLDGIQELEERSPFEQVADLLADLLAKTVSEGDKALEDDAEVGGDSDKKPFGLVAYLKDFFDAVQTQEKLANQLANTA